MKHIIFCTLALFIAFSTVIFADDHANACTEADNPTSFLLCQTLRNYCASTVAACDGNSVCLSAVGTSYEIYAAAFDFSGITDCDCAEFTCDADFTDDSGSNSGAVGLVASFGLAIMMKLFA